MPKKITLVINTLGCGGAERVCMLLANDFADKGHEISVIIFSMENAHYTLNSNVNVFDLGRRSSWDVLRTCYRLRQTVKKLEPDIILTFMTNVTYYLMLSLIALRNKPRIFATMHIHHSTGFGTYFKLFNRCFFKKIMLKCEKLICCSQDMNDDLCSFYSFPTQKVLTINNPVDIELCQKKAHEECDHEFYKEGKPVLLAVGSLCQQKNYPLMLEAVAKIQREREVRLIILGDGPLKSELEIVRDKLGLDGVVDFVGNVLNPFAYMKDAKLYIMSSIFEGFPMVLLEAMACKLPVICTNCPSGPRELIKNNKTGILVPMDSADELSAAITNALDHYNTMLVMSENAAENVKNKYNIDSISDKYLAILETIID